MHDLKTIEQKVGCILKHYPETRDSYKALLYRYYTTHHNISTLKEFMFDKNIPSSESITRASRKIQESGLYPPSSNTRKFRNQQEENYKQYGLGL